MHIPPYDNRNMPIIAEDHASVPRVYFNLVKLAPGEVFTYRLPAYESVVVPSVGALEICLEGGFTAELSRRAGLWEDDPEGVYVPTGTEARLTARQACETFIAGARYEKTLTPFHVRRKDLDHVQYGSDETKTHRKIKHIIGQKQRDKVGRLLVSELFTVGAGGWSGFPPHKHDTDAPPGETHHDEAYHFRFRPENGFGAQFLQREKEEFGQVFHVKSGSSFVIESGYHPCVAAPGFEMYYFTILGGASRQALGMNFHPSYAYQLETIPGIKDMVAKFK